MITTHVLDTTRGRPADGVAVRLETADGDVWKELARGTTDSDGRLKTLTDGIALRAGRYRLTFETGAWFKRHGGVSFHPAIDVLFEITNPEDHVHVPLLLSPFGYTTYRGS